MKKQKKSESEDKEDIENEISKKVEKPKINKEKFREFFQRKDFSPVLQKIQEVHEEINLEKIADSSQKIKKPIEKNEFEYLPNSEQNDEPKYHKDSEFTINLLHHTAPITSNKPARIQENQEMAFNPSNKQSSNNIETYLPMKKFDERDKENISPRERDVLLKNEIKYKSSI